MLFAGVQTSFTDRRAYLDFGLPYGRKEVSRGDPMLYGLTFGKRYPFGIFRLQLGSVIDIGSVTEDTIPGVVLSDGSVQTLVLKSLMYHGGLTPELQLPLRIAPDTAFFLFTGFGVHFMYLQEEEQVMSQAGVTVRDPSLEDHGSFSGSFHFGIGFEVKVSQNYGFSVTYTFRTWDPISYGKVGDLFPYKAVAYREHFNTHQIQLLLLF
jgi:hypothetical protein